jgi:hypothetical protein
MRLPPTSELSICMRTDGNKFPRLGISFLADELHQASQADKVSIGMTEVCVVAIDRCEMDESIPVIVFQGKVRQAGKTHIASIKARREDRNLVC